MSEGTRTSRAAGLREAGGGVATAMRGMRLWGTSPGLMAWGLIPGAIATMLFAAAGVLVATRIGSWSGSLASLVADEGGWWYGTVQAIAALAIVAASLLVVIYTFTAVTLTLGQPFFERISRHVDAQAGFTATEPDERWARALLRSVAEGLRLALLTVPLAVVLFLIGLVPAVGGVASFVLGAVLGGWFLALELTAYPIARRGHVTLAARRAVLRGSRPRVTGFGAALFVMFLIPFGAALLMPAAMAGATLLVQDLEAGREDGLTGVSQP